MRSAALPGRARRRRGRRRPAASRAPSASQARRERSTRAQPSWISMFELGRRLGDLTGDRLGPLLGLGAERVGLLGGELAPAGLGVAQLGREGVQLAEAVLGLRRLLGVRLGHERLDVVVDEHEAAEDVSDVLQARRHHERLFGRLAPGDEARVLPRLEVLGHRRRHHDERGEGVAAAWAASRARRSRAPSSTSRSRGRPRRRSRRPAPPRRTRPCRRRRGRARRPWRANFGSVPKAAVSIR